jgi:hypothetical protein
MLNQDEMNEKLKEIQDLSIEELKNILEINRDYEFEDNKKLISCAHEIVFSINASVLMENEKGELTGTREVCSKNFHIPVPIDKDYEIFMKTFFDYIENCLINGIQESSKP